MIMKNAESLKEYGGGSVIIFAVTGSWNVEAGQSSKSRDGGTGMKLVAISAASLRGSQYFWSIDALH
jgi:hypothetical protein